MVSAPLPLSILGEPFFLCKYKRGVCYFEYFNGRFYKGKPTIRTHDNLRGTWYICDKKSILSKKNRICLNIQCSYLYQPIHEIWLTKVATPTHTNFFTLPSSYPSVPFFFFFFFFFHVFGVKRAGFNTPGRHCFLNFLDSFNCSRIFLVLEMYCKKATFSAFLVFMNLFLNSKFLTDLPQRLRKIWEILGKTFFIYKTHGEP